MQHFDFYATTSPNTGVFGLLPCWVNQEANFDPANSRSTMVHDMVEHRGGFAIGSVEDEIEAFGTLIVFRNMAGLKPTPSQDAFFYRSAPAALGHEIADFVHRGANSSTDSRSGWFREYDLDVRRVIGNGRPEDKQLTNGDRDLLMTDGTTLCEFLGELHHAITHSDELKGKTDSQSEQPSEERREALASKIVDRLELAIARTLNEFDRDMKRIYNEFSTLYQWARGYDLTSRSGETLRGYLGIAPPDTMDEDDTMADNLIVRVSFNKDKVAVQLATMWSYKRADDEDEDSEYIESENREVCKAFARHRLGEHPACREFTTVITELDSLEVTPYRDVPNGPWVCPTVH